LDMAKKEKHDGISPLPKGEGRGKNLDRGARCTAKRTPSVELARGTFFCSTRGGGEGASLLPKGGPKEGAVADPDHGGMRIVWNI